MSASVRARRATKLNARELTADLLEALDDLNLERTTEAGPSTSSRPVQSDRVLKIRNSTPSLTLKIKRRTDLNQAEAVEVFALFEANMRTLYEASQDGYDPKGKRKEVLDPDGRFLLARDADGALAGYALWRFETEETADGNEIPIVFCWELQIAEQHRGKGLAKTLMRCLERIGRRQEMQKSMLSVFHHNEPARAFYEKIGYAIDEIDPSRCPDGPYQNDSDITIMSRSLR